MIDAKLSDLPATKYVYDPGDRILCRVSCDLSQNDRFKTLRAIKKFAGNDLRILIVDCRSVRIEKLTHDAIGQFSDVLASRKDIAMKSIDCGVLNMDCVVTRLTQTDEILVTSNFQSETHKRNILYSVHQWVDKACNVRWICAEV